MIKGHVCIDLHNHNSGFTERIEQDNMVTNAMKYLLPLEYWQGWQNNADYKIITPIATRGLGGLFLFDGKLDEDANNIKFPRDVHLVGHAGTDVTTSTKLKGSQNNSETKLKEDSIVHVWDFATSQANGVIASLALTHVNSGNNPFPYSLGNNIGDKNIGAIGDGSMIKYDTSKQIMYFVRYSQGTHMLTAYKQKVNLLSIGITENLYDQSANKHSPEKIWEVLVGEGQAASGRADLPPSYVLYNEDCDYMYVIVRSDWSDASVYVVPVSDVLNEVSSPTVKQVATQSEVNRIVYSWNIASLFLKDGNLYVNDLDNKAYMITPNGVSKASNTIIGPTINNIIVSGNKIEYPDGTIVTLDANMQDIYTRSVAYHGAWVTDQGDTNVHPLMMYLGTICNLSSPVEKTSTTSMKVTYTLSNA